MGVFCLCIVAYITDLLTYTIDLRVDFHANVQLGYFLLLDLFACVTTDPSTQVVDCLA